MEQPLSFLAEVTGIEPAISGLTGRRDNQLRYTSRLLTEATGIEPAISGLTGRRDNQLRYASNRAYPRRDSNA